LAKPEFYIKREQVVPLQNSSLLIRRKKKNVQKVMVNGG